MMFPKRENRKAMALRRAALVGLAAVSMLAAQDHGATTQSGSGELYNPGYGNPGYGNPGNFDRAMEGEWPFWGGNAGNTHAGTGRQPVNVNNANLLQQKWVFQTAGDVSATPTVSQGSVYVPDWGGYIYRIDAATGKAIWSHQLSEYTGNAKSLSRNSPAIGPNQIVFGDQAISADGAVLMAVDRAAGKLLWKTKLDPSFGAIITSSPVIVGNRVYVGVASLQENLALQAGFQLSFRGSVAAVDLSTGKILWQTYTVPSGYTGGSVWGSNLVVDERRQTVFATTGNNYTVPESVSGCLLGAPTDATAALKCLDPTDYIDAVLALDLQTGTIKWAHRLEGADTWTVSCIVSGDGVPCPDPSGPDYDFGSGANLIRTQVNGKFVEAVGAGQKSGVYWALNPDTGAIVWQTQVGPGGTLGGMEWGSATDGNRVYSAVNNNGNQSFLLQPAKQQQWNGAAWTAMDAGTGAVIWQVPVPGQNPLAPSMPSGATGQVTVANGVFYAGSLAGDMVALDAATGKQLWKFASGGSVVSGPSIVDGTLYWGSGYTNLHFGTPNNKLYAFSLPGGSYWGGNH